MKPGEIINKEGFIELNKTSNSIKIKVSNRGDRPCLLYTSPSPRD